MNKKRLTQAIKKVLQYEKFGRRAEVSLFLTDDKGIWEMNRDYRGIDRPTDVLSFSQIEGEPAPGIAETTALGDIVISVETAQRQASEAGRTLDDEMDTLAVHGMFHLLGYDHGEDYGECIMREKEEDVRRRLEDGR